jgi:hypothetical protein
MPTQPYRNADGQRIPGTTTVIGQNLGWNKDALIKWANREGLAGRDIRDRSAQREANIGTAVHAMIEGYLHGALPEERAATELAALSDEDQQRAMVGFAAFRRWLRNSRLEIVATELFGVDDEWQVGFCLDALALDRGDGKPIFEVLDWKSGSGIYAEHFIQLAAYTTLVERQLVTWFGRPVRLGGAHVLRVGKDTGAFTHAYWPRKVLEDGWRAFTRLRTVHALRPRIESYVR